MLYIIRNVYLVHSATGLPGHFLELYILFIIFNKITYQSILVLINIVEFENSKKSMQA